MELGKSETRFGTKRTPGTKIASLKGLRNPNHRTFCPERLRKSPLDFPFFRESNRLSILILTSTEFPTVQRHLFYPALGFSLPPGSSINHHDPPSSPRIPVGTLAQEMKGTIVKLPENIWPSTHSLNARLVPPRMSHSEGVKQPRRGSKLSASLPLNFCFLEINFESLPQARAEPSNFNFSCRPSAQIPVVFFLIFPTPLNL